MAVNLMALRLPWNLRNHGRRAKSDEMLAEVTTGRRAEMP
jgi:hypothetical protein